MHPKPCTEGSSHSRSSQLRARSSWEFIRSILIFSTSIRAAVFGGTQERIDVLEFRTGSIRVFFNLIPLFRSGS